MNFFKKIFREVKRVASQVSDFVSGIPVVGKILPYAGGPIAPLIQAAELIDDPADFLAGGLDVASNVLLGQATGGLSSMLANPLQTMVGTIPQSVVDTLNAPGALAALQSAAGIPTNMTGGFTLPLSFTDGSQDAEPETGGLPMGFWDAIGGIGSDILTGDILDYVKSTPASTMEIPGFGTIDVPENDFGLAGWGLGGEDFGPPLPTIESLPGYVPPPQNPVQVMGGPLQGGAMDFAVARRLPRTIPLGALVGDSGQTMLPQGYHVKTLGFRKPYAGRNAGAYAVRNRRTNYLNLSALRRASHRLQGATKIVRHLFSLPKHTIKSKKRSSRFGKGR